MHQQKRGERRPIGHLALQRRVGEIDKNRIQTMSRKLTRDAPSLPLVQRSKFVTE